MIDERLLLLAMLLAVAVMVATGGPPDFGGP